MRENLPGNSGRPVWIRVNDREISLASMKKSAASATESILPDSELITDRSRIARLLERLASQHTLLTVVIPGQPQHYTSNIVAVEGDLVLLDELMPADGHRLLLEVRTLQVAGKLEGIDFRFIATLEGVDTTDDMITYRANLPARLEYRQRRMDYRAHIPIAQRLRVIIDEGDEGVIEGELYDLSLGGVGMILPGETPTLLPGSWYECAIEMPDETWLYCQIEFCHSRTIPAHERHLIGARYADLSPVQAQLVGRCIGMLERELIRKRAAG